MLRLKRVENMATLESLIVEEVLQQIFRLFEVLPAREEAHLSEMAFGPLLNVRVGVVRCPLGMLER